MTLPDALRAAIATDPTLGALHASDAPRLDFLIDYLVEALPQHDQHQALRFAQRVLNQQSLVMKRDAHGAKESWLTPEDRMRLAQQEVDWTALGHLTRAGYQALFARPIEKDAQADALPLSASDRHHPSELDPQQPWTVDREISARIAAEAVRLVQLLDAGNLCDSAWEHRHATVPTILEVLARDFGTPDALPALRLGYAGFLARQSQLGLLRATANHALDPGELMNALQHRPWEPPTLQLIQLLGILRRAGIEAGLLSEDPERSRAALQRGYAVALQEDGRTSPLPAGR